jgi:D-arabinose 1-dehydrogenase-like Zn-dependent alcohol dehydrogenase
MKVAQITKPGAGFQIVEREIPAPDAGQVRIKVQACGVCHSDVLTVEGSWPGIQYPRVPGHEVAGIIDEVGVGVSEWKKGQRVGVGWHGGQDNTCLECRRGDFRNCKNLKVTGISYDGGYQEYMLAPVEALVAMPESGRKRDACKETRSKCVHDSNSMNAAEALQKLGGAQAILGTAPSSKAMSELINGLRPNGKLMVLGLSFDPIEVTPVQLISGNRTIQGWAAGTPTDSEDTLCFAELTGVRPMIETYPLEKADEAYARMMSG